MVTFNNANFPDPPPELVLQRESQVHSIFFQRLRIILLSRPCKKDSHVWQCKFSKFSSWAGLAKRKAKFMKIVFKCYRSPSLVGLAKRVAWVWQFFLQVLRTRIILLRPSCKEDGWQFFENYPQHPPWLASEKLERLNTKGHPFSLVTKRMVRCNNFWGDSFLAVKKRGSRKRPNV